jgi:hypothetical protein
VQGRSGIRRYQLSFEVDAIGLRGVIRCAMASAVSKRA